MSHPPSTPAKVPAAATTYTPATQDADLRSQINSQLLREGHAAKIQERFLHSLDAHNSNWPSAIQSHALALLRSGEVSTFPALMRRVLEDVRRDTAAATAALASSTTANNSSPSTHANNDSNPAKDGVNGAAAVNGASRTAGGVNGTSAGADGATNLAIPTAVVEAVLKVVKESLEAVCEIENDGSAGG
ncbi:hypothetical protein F5B22DRAFT_583608 [Xylaria bambusicola]|uniref:uncharacterized protein n=1 Tax=Xylaria bambusicola TaxID=326684 RepID=UPI0020089301|nr:uncharacterized protein F5B22DRAFT_583608 [Xylaria bambusicola]KAI0528099.1 hypothetical protein F5B22DRAFT_583608 [Xylaria bambusicola]